MSQCWFLQPSAFCIGGKWGDCVQMTGAFHAISERTGNPVNVVCSTEFASVFEGTSFVNAVAVDTHWAEGIPKMKAVAQERFGGGTVLQFWNDSSSPELLNKRGGIALQINGKHFATSEPHYGASMMLRAGFTWPEAMRLRPVFDMRNPVREAQLLDRCWPKAKRNKPMLLVAFDGQSSPWGYLPEAYPVLTPLYRNFHVVNIGKLKATRVYDMLILFEHAIGLITIDSLPLHLVAATHLPYVAFVRGDWRGSEPKGNCTLRITYADSLRRLPEVGTVLKDWARASKSPMLVSQGG